jgi:hypothetical protein
MVKIKEIKLVSIDVMKKFGGSGGVGPFIINLCASWR